MAQGKHVDLFPRSSAPPPAGRGRHAWKTPAWRRMAAGGALAGLALAGLGVMAPGRAADTTDFAARFSVNANGTIATVGNQLLTCSTTEANCSAALAGGAYNNNSFSMIRLDADNDASTYNSSSSRLDLPEGSTVLWAGLYWGARLTRGTGGEAGTGDRSKMLLKTPGAAAYQEIASDESFGPNTGSSNAYQEFADVTGVVAAAGAGEYWGANVVAATGIDRHAGWALTVVFRAPGMPLRNLTVFDGFVYVSRTVSPEITISGFTAPKSGPVTVALTAVAYEGDGAQAGDFAVFNGTQLATSLSPGNNFFNSTNDNNGAHVTTRNPAYENMLGFDVKALSATGMVANGDTEATIKFGTNQDTYFPGVVTTAINLHAPDFSASSKTAVNLNGNNPALPGDVIQYTIYHVNYGLDGAENAVSVDPIPAGLTYLAGSLQLLGRPNTPLSDIAGDDPGEVLGNTVTVRVGAGATAFDGGRIAVGETYGYVFLATVDPALEEKAVHNTATLDYTTATTHTPGAYGLPPASTDIGLLADVSVAKTMSPSPVAAGETVTSVLTVSNHGPTAATGVSVTDTLPPGMVPVSVSVSTAAPCALPAPPATPAESAILTCQVGTLAPSGAGATATVTIVGRVPSAAPPGMIVNRATVATTSPDPDLTDNTASASIPVVQSADLEIAKESTKATLAPGTLAEYTVTVTNLGPSDAKSVIVTDSVPAASQGRLSVVSATLEPGGVSCQPLPPGTIVQCAPFELAEGKTATMTVTAWVAPNTPA